MAVNIRGTFFLTQAAARRMEVAPSHVGVSRPIISVGSVNAEIVGESRGDYCMSKAALGMMTRLFASRLANAGVAVFEVRPGIIRTPMTAPAQAEYDAFIGAGGVPIARWGEPSDVAAAIATLAVGGVPYATGVVIEVAGGMQLHRV